MSQNKPNVLKDNVKSCSFARDWKGLQKGQKPQEQTTGKRKKKIIAEVFSMSLDYSSAEHCVLL